MWHSLSIEEIKKKLEADLEAGLSEKEVRERQKIYGLNKLPEEKPLSKLKIFFSQFNSPLIYILVIAGIVTLILRDYKDAAVIFGAVFLNTIAGFIQENKASQTLRALKKVVKYTAEVQRAGNLKIIDASELVQGDIIVLNPGDKVPADARIMESRDLKINEMALTGEWMAAEKEPEVLAKETPLAERDNMVYMGCVIEDGKGKAIVTETGINTEIGKIATMVRETKEEKTPYQKKLSHFSKIAGIVIGIICIGIFVGGTATGGKLVEMFIISVAVAVAAIPEGLIIGMTVILALGMQRILKKKGLVRRLVSAETLGSASVICTDKTGTLTEGEMKVGEIIGDKFLALKAATLISEAFIENPDDPKGRWIVRGRPTDKALLEAGIEFGIDCQGEFKKNKIAEIPFNPINKFAAVLYRENNEKILYVCGAPEKILKDCNLKEKERKELENESEKLAQKGLRIMAAAYKETDELKSADLQSAIYDLTFAGLISLKDPIRPEAKEAIKICRQAGMKPIIVTGDHKLTAKAVAEELGFKIKDENILEGKDLDELSDKEFSQILSQIQIYARVEPKHKMRIIEAWQARGEVVVMTGDGINDAPALKKADVGVALGSGTEVAKETSDLILLNDSFSIIVAAVEEGRMIVDNMRKVITYLLSDSFTELFLIGGSMSIFWLSGRPWVLPITAIQILWTNLIEDGLPHIALAFEPKEKDIMRKKPGGNAIPLLTREMKVIIFVIGLATDFVLLAVLFWLIRQDYEIHYLRTIIFAMLGVDSISYAFCCKSLRRNLWQINIFDNKILIFAWVFGLTALLAAIYLPVLNQLLGTVPLSFSAWLIIIGLGIIEIILIEAAKWYFISKKDYD